MVRRRHQLRQVALLVESSRIYGRGVLRGIGKYVQAHGRWKVYHTERKLSEVAPPWLRTWKGDGIIARIENQRLARRLRQLKVPVVNLFEREDLADLPAVLTDNDAIARLAAEHLIQRGLEHFAYCGFPIVYSSDERCSCFVRHVAAAGYKVNVYSSGRRRPNISIAASEDYALRREDTLARWILSLPKPVGIMACNDLRAQQVLMVCDGGGLAVPDEVAVIGVDNDEVICGLAQPPLSSIEQNPEQVGYQAAALLDRLMQGEAPPRGPIVVEPQGVVARQSTEFVAVADADAADALHYIREHACDGIDVDDVVAHVPLSRRTLERRFAALLGRSPKEAIIAAQLEHVKRLLAMTDYPLAKIAQLTGFQYVESMCSLFKKTTGRTPGRYRHEIRG
jgi:LacI family transcriptional regulator